MVADYRKYLVFGLSFMLIVFVMAVGPLKQRGEAVTGHELYKGMCASCHGELGEGQAAGAIGNKAPALKNSQWLAMVSDEFLATTIREGRHGTSMAAFPVTQLNEERMAELIGFLRHEFGNPNLVAEEPKAIPEGDAARGKELFAAKQCVICHGEQGKGGQNNGLNLNNKGFIDSALKDPQYIYQITNKGKANTAMGPMGLNEQEVADLLAFFKEEWLPAAEQTQKKAEEDAAALAKAIKQRSANLVVKPEAETGVAFIDAKSLVQDKCFACHKLGDEGSKSAIGPDLTKVGARLDLATILKTMQEGHVGTAMVPANLTPEQTKVVADYLATLK